MKRSTKILWTIAMVLLIAGVICTGGAFALGGFTLNGISSSHAERFEVSYPIDSNSSTTKIIVDDSNVAVQFITGSYDSISVSYVDTDTHKYTITENTLSGGKTELVIKGITEWSSISWLKNIGLIDADTTLIITVPRDYDLFSLVSITTSNSKVIIDDIHSDAEIYVKTSNGSIRATNLDVSEISLTTSNSRVELLSVFADDLVVVKTSNGNVSANDVTAKNLSLITSNSSISAEDIITKDLSLTTSNGDLTLNRITAETQITAVTSNSSIKIDDIDSKSITLNTSNGSVTGYVTGNKSDYVITSRTSNAKNNLDSDFGSGAGGENSPSRKLNVKTSNARIEINFIG